jgi:8-oxo-dGTP diphosphatase
VTTRDTTRAISSEADAGSRHEIATKQKRRAGFRFGWIGNRSSGSVPLTPCLCVSLAVFREGKVLLALRTAPPYAGAFSLPGGKVEAGETLEAAALRELAEEVQVEARIVGFNQHVEAIARDRNGTVSYHYVIASFVGTWIRGDGTPGPEAGAIVWAEPAEVGRLAGTPQLDTVVSAAAEILEAGR